MEMRILRGSIQQFIAVGTEDARFSDQIFFFQAIGLCCHDKKSPTERSPGAQVSTNLCT
jgi:hypothetical protein